MTQDRPQDGVNQRHDEAGLPSWDARTELYVEGSTSPRYGLFGLLAKSWLEELPRAVPDTYGWKVAGEVSYPPDRTPRGGLVSLRLPHGQVLTLQLNAYAESPRNDRRWFRRVEVREATSRTDKAALAALSVLEGSGVRKEGVGRIARRLRGHHVDLSAAEGKLLAFARVLLLHHRPDFDQVSEEGIELLIRTCERVADVADKVRQLGEFLEFGSADRPSARREVKDAQTDVYAAELHHIVGMSQQEVARKLRLAISERDRDKGGHRTTASRIKRGTDLFVRALGEEGWDRYRRTVRAAYEQSEGTHPLIE